MVGLFYLVGIVVPVGQLGGLEHIKHQYRVVSRERTAALVYDIRLLEPIFLACVHDSRHGIVGILLYRVVHAALIGAVACAVVVHTEAAAYVDKVDIKAHSRQLHIELCCLAKRILYVAYLGYLATYVKMYQFQAVAELLLLQIVDGFEQFARVEAKLALVAARFFPFAATRTR